MRGAGRAAAAAPADDKRKKELEPLCGYLEGSVNMSSGWLQSPQGRERIAYFRCVRATPQPPLSAHLISLRPIRALLSSLSPTSPFVSGSKLVELMVDAKQRRHGLDQISTPAQAEALCAEMLRHGLMKRVEIVEAAAEDGEGAKESKDGKDGRRRAQRVDGMRVLQLPPPPRGAGLSQALVFEPGGGSKESRVRYMWDVADHWARWKLGGALLAVLALCLYQVWPPIVRTVVWWVAVTLLLLILLLTLLQFVVFACCWLFGWSVWIIPNFWVESTFKGMFKPLIEVEQAGKGQVWTRLVLAALFVALGVWAYHAPAEVQALIDTQKQMVEDLYAGKLLGDASAPGGSQGLSVGGGRGSFFGRNMGPNRYGGRPAKTLEFDEIERLLQDEDKPTAEVPKPAAEGGAGAEARDAEAAPLDADAAALADAVAEAAREAAAAAAVDAMIEGEAAAAAASDSDASGGASEL